MFLEDIGKRQDSEFSNICQEKVFRFNFFLNYYVIFLSLFEWKLLFDFLFFLIKILYTDNGLDVLFI